MRKTFDIGTVVSSRYGDDFGVITQVYGPYNFYRVDWYNRATLDHVAHGLFKDGAVAEYADGKVYTRAKPIRRITLRRAKMARVKAVQVMFYRFGSKIAQYPVISRKGLKRVYLFMEYLF